MPQRTLQDWSKHVLALCLGILGVMNVVYAGDANLIMVNGKIATVDERFTITQAIAIKDQQILATGSNQAMRKLAAPNARVIDLGGRTVIPGLIDNHSHWVRAAEHNELRFDGVVSRGYAIKRLTQRIAETPHGHWIAVLGGWSEEQFRDDPRGFPLAELDQIAPNHPVVIQSIYQHTYLNTAALKAAGIDANTSNPNGGTIEKDAQGQLTGVIRGAGGVAFVAAKVPMFESEAWLANTQKLVQSLNAMGITAWGDAGGRGMDERHYLPYETLAKDNRLNARVFWTTIRQPASPAQVDQVLKEIQTLKPYQGNAYFNHIGWGESVYSPVTTQLLRKGGNTKPEDISQMARVIRALADRGFYLNSHVEMEPVIDVFLDQYEALSREKPIQGLRWSFSHLDQVTTVQLERMKRLGMTAMIHSRPLIQGVLMHKVHGEAAWDMPPFRRVQDSGIVWGLGSDATAVTTSNPFYTLAFAITGRAIGGHLVNRQSISREQALIAHTRNNAQILFHEHSLGSIAPGKFADLLVLDRDYLTVPAPQIQEIKPLLTMVGGRVVHAAAPFKALQ
jgi:predicted amidohydrolase YtcJ